MDTAITIPCNTSADPDLLTKYARHDRTCCVVTGLFTVQFGQRRAQRKLDVSVPGPDDSTLYFRGPDVLTAFDLRVLQGLTAFAGVQGVQLNNDGGNMQQQLSLKLDDAVRQVEAAPRLYFATSYWQFAKEIGMVPESCHDYTRKLRISLERLYAVTMTAEKDRKRVSTRMISTMALDQARNTLAVALNATVSQAILGGVCTRIPMQEVRALVGDPARILHQHLCALLFEDGTGHRFRMTTLMGYVYPAETREPLPRTQRKRATAIRKALQELIGLGWRVTAESNGAIYHITRPIRRRPPAKVA